MAKTAELILRLVDQVTGPARAVSAALRQVNAATRAISDTGRNLRRSSTDMAGLSVPLLMIGREAAQQVYEFEKAGNAADAYGMLLDGQRDKLEDYVLLLNEVSPYTSNEIMQAANELFRAGFTFEQAMGSLEGALQLGVAGDLDVGTATDLATNILTSMRLPMETMAQVEESLTRVNDALAYSAANSNADVEQMAQAFKYVGPLAASVGMDIDELSTMMMVMARNGIKGAEAGVALRSGIVRMLRPTIFAQRQFKQLGIDIGEFVTLGEDIDFGNIQSAVSDLGVDLSTIKDPIQALLDDDTLRRSPLKLVERVMSLVNEAVEGDAADMQVLGEAVAQGIMAGAENVDFMGFIKELNEKGAGAVDLSYIFDVRQGSRLISLMTEDLDVLKERFNIESEGAAAAMFEKRIQGIVGVMNRWDAAVNNIFLAIAGSGVLDAVSELIDKTSKFIVQISMMNPEILKFGTYGLGALAVMAPLGFILSGLAGTLAFMANPITIVAGALGYLAYLNWDGITTFFNSAKTAFTGGLSPETLERAGQALDTVQQAFADIGAGIDWAGSGESFGKWMADVVNGIPAFVDGLVQMRKDVQPVLDWFEPIIVSLAQALGQIANELKDFAFGTFDGLSQGLQNFQDTLDPHTVAKLQEWATALRDYAFGMDAVKDAQWQQSSSNQSTGWSAFLADEGEKLARGLNATVREIEAIQAFFQDPLGALETMKANIDAKGMIWRDSIIAVFTGIDLTAAGKNIIDTLVAGMLSAIPGLEGAVSTANKALYLLSGGRGGVNPNAPIASPPAASTYGPVPDPPMFAKGGSYDPGLIITGEKGPELQMASGRGQVFSADETRDMLSGKNQRGSGGDTHYWYITGANADEIARKVSDKIDAKLQRSRGLSMDDRLTSG